MVLNGIKNLRLLLSQVKLFLRLPRVTSKHMRRFQESPSRIGLAVGVSLVFSVLVDVSLRKGIADPAGSTIERSLPTLGFLGVRDVGVGKTIRFTIEAEGEEEAKNKVESICSTFLTNPVIEEAKITIENTDQVEGN